MLKGYLRQLLNRKPEMTKILKVKLWRIRSSSRSIIFNQKFREDLRWWFRKDKAKAERVLNLIESVTVASFTGLRKPEPLKHFKSSIWSRRITQEHRLVYRVTDVLIEFLQCRYHY